jgi:hypothetical protein
MNKFFKTLFAKALLCGTLVVLIAISFISCAKDIVDVNGSIHGVIKDFNTGALIANCQVSLTPSGKSAITGLDGTFEFGELEPGSYTLSFSKAGYEESSKTVSVTSGETSSVNITLKAKSAFAASSNKLDFGDLSSTQELYFYNNSDEIVSFSMSNIPSWASFSHSSGSVPAGGNTSLSVSVNRDAVDYGTHTQIVSVAYKGKTSGTLSLTIQMQKVKLSAPTVTINAAAEDITQNGFTIQGELTATGGAVVTSYGHCWGLTQNPTVENNKTDNGSTTDIGSFKSVVNELTPGTTYYVRTYATNQYGTAYSQQIAVTTQDVASNKWDGNIAQSFARGSGTSADPYIIETGGQLLLMKDFKDKYFELANNIDLDNHNWLPFVFSGFLNGKGCVVSNLKIERNNDGQGLFSVISKGNVKNLTIKNVNIKAPAYSEIGALVGCLGANGNDGSISDCHVILNENSQIIGGNEVGGLVGFIDRGNVSNCTVEYSGTSTYVIKGNESVGGLIGRIGKRGSSHESTISSCHAVVNVEGANYIGGIVGTAEGVYAITVEKCSYRGVISGEKYVGGIMGYFSSDGKIIASKADVELTASDGCAGGIVGMTYKYNSDADGIFACYATGTMSSTSSEKTFGGLYGCSDHNYYFSSVMSYSTIASSIENFDGIAGANYQYGRSEYCASVVKTRFSETNKGYCNNMTTFLKECYQSEYDKYWDYTKTWTWSGKVGDSQKNVSCPRLSWE